MKPRHALALLVLVLAVASAGLRAAAPQQVSASYDVLRNGWHVAVMTETFEARDGTYRIVSHSSATGLLALFERNPLRFVSFGQVTASGLRPLHFEGARSEADPRRVRADFDWKAKSLKLAHDGRTETVALPPNTQDRLSVMYQFMFHAFDGVQRFESVMTNGRKLDQYRYAIRTDVEIETPLGRMKTVHLVRQRGPGDSATEIWLAPHLHHLPVRMVIEEEDGPRYEQTVVKLETRP
jgi:hypothetical protein